MQYSPRTAHPLQQHILCETNLWYVTVLFYKCFVILLIPCRFYALRSKEGKCLNTATHPPRRPFLESFLTIGVVCCYSAQYTSVTTQTLAHQNDMMNIVSCTSLFNIWENREITEAQIFVLSHKHTKPFSIIVLYRANSAHTAPPLHQTIRPVTKILYLYTYTYYSVRFHSNFSQNCEIL